MSDSSSTGNAAPKTPASRRTRPWLFLLLLLALIALLATRADLRQQAANMTRSATRAVMFDGLGLSPRTLFVWRLRIAGLEDSPPGKRWLGAVARAGADPVSIGRRYQTDARFAPDSIEAHVYQTTLERGEELIWRLSRTQALGDRLYASLERRSGDAANGWSTVTDLLANGEPQREIVDRDGRYRIVLQPELFAGVDYSLAIASGGSLGFPVRGATPRDIGSGFGAPRDGGSRAHHGVDIFASRGTPVTAVLAGRVRTGTGGIGGNYLWLAGLWRAGGVFGLGGARYYYAHLDSFAVASGDRVHEGDVLGYVGNTGNARTTPPHLHFGIYTVGGPIDPAPFLKPVPQLPRE